MSRIGIVANNSRSATCEHHQSASLIAIWPSHDSDDYLLFCAECAANTLLHHLTPLQPPQESD